jgi:hypothetical protein
MLEIMPIGTALDAGIRGADIAHTELVVFSRLFREPDLPGPKAIRRMP